MFDMDAIFCADDGAVDLYPHIGCAAAVISDRVQLDTLFRIRSYRSADINNCSSCASSVELDAFLA